MNRVLSVSCSPALRTFALLAFLWPLSAFPEIYKWVDENGVTHYGDDAKRQHEDKRQRVEVKVPAPNASDREAARARAEKERQALNHLTQRRKQAESEARQRKAKVSSVGVDKPAETPCQKGGGNSSRKACFMPFRTARGGIRAEAYEHCTEAIEPRSVCPP